MKPFRKIFHPTDFSKASTAAFSAAVALAKRERANLVIVHVLIPPIPMITDGYVSPKAFEELETAARRDAERRLSALVTKARKAGAVASTLLIEGSPADRIVGAARRKGADLIVMGTHGRTGLPRLFMGSVASRVIPLAPCPVLTVRGR